MGYPGPTTRLNISPYFATLSDCSEKERMDMGEENSMDYGFGLKEGIETCRLRSRVVLLA